ncbi:hypothetical protein [Parafrankia discariae]|uniref:hypothetical protein n=1 Tax=Parafrankia discariae TaxID=365528 RepID=UPI0012B6AB2E|nr:hypothetical protein [Parafrankia discariae]
MGESVLLDCGRVQDIGREVLHFDGYSTAMWSDVPEVGECHAPVRRALGLPPALQPPGLTSPARNLPVSEFAGFRLPAAPVGFGERRSVAGRRVYDPLIQALSPRGLLGYTDSSVLRVKR